MKQSWKMALLFGGILLLGGCSGRELEDREFPSVLVYFEEDFQESGRLQKSGQEESSRLQKSGQKESSRYLDYSQTKAVIFEDDLAEEPELMQEAVEYLKERPEFAGNLLIFVGDDEVLTLAEKEDLGNELQDYYKNHNLELSAVTLTELINFFQNQEESLSIPILRESGKNLFPQGEVRLNNQL